MVFTICGSTQELHEKYRINSSLQQIFDNAMAFKKNNNYNNDWIQHIKFNYNIDDFNTNMKPIIKMFSHSLLINSLPYNERFLVDGQCDIKMQDKLSQFYIALMKNALLRKKQNKKFKICCKSFETNFICIDQFGDIYPCFLYRFYSNKKFNINDYSDIFNYKYDFCYECELYTKKLLEMNNLERMA